MLSVGTLGALRSGRNGRWLTSPSVSVQMCGVLADDSTRLEHVTQIKEMLLGTIIQDENLRQLLRGMDQQFREEGREAPNWCRLFAGECGTAAEGQARPIRLKDLDDLEGHARGGQVSFRKRYDLDTVTLVSRSLDVLKSIRLVFKRDFLGAFRAEKDDLSRGRLYVRGVERDGEFPRVRFRTEGLPRDQVILKTGYATKRFIGYPRGHMENKTFVAQMYCNLTHDHQKWAAWECCYAFMAACLRGGWSASSHVLVPRSSSFCIPNPHRGNGAKTWMAGIAVSSQDDCREFMDLVLDPVLQREFFEEEFAKVVEGVLNQRRRALDRMRRQQETLDDDNQADEGAQLEEEAAPGDDDGEVVDLAEAGEAIVEGRSEGERVGDGEDLLFDVDTCLEHFMGMMQNLYFVTTIQLGREGCGTTTDQIFPDWPCPGPPGNATLERIGSKIMGLIQQYICLDRAAACPTLLAPNVGMEVTMQQEAEGHTTQGGRSNRQFKVESPLFQKKQGVRLHLDRRKFKDLPQEWVRRVGHLGAQEAGHTFKWYDAWGNMSKTDGPVSFKGKLSDERLDDEGGDFDALLELLLPMEGRFGVQAPLLCIYECTYRATSPYSIFQKEKQVVESYLTLSSRNPTRVQRRKALERVCNVMVRVCGGLVCRHASRAVVWFCICDDIYKSTDAMHGLGPGAEGGSGRVCAAPAWGCPHQVRDCVPDGHPA